jgi:putative FmdB family regulatory protein
MPTYDYVCTKCGHAFEVFQSMKDKPLSRCPKCKRGRVKRLIGSGAGLLFKGSGFYETDYKRKSGAPEKGESAGAASGAASAASVSSGEKSGGGGAAAGGGGAGEKKPAASASRSDSGAAKTGGARQAG